MKGPLGIACAFLSGISFGLALAWKTEPKVLRVELELSEARVAEMMTRIRERQPAGPIAPISGNDKVSADEMPVGTPIVEIKENLKRDLVDYATHVAPYVGSEFTYIPNEEYEANDEYDKITIEVFRDDLQYQLVVDGETVIDWETILTPEIVEDLKGKTCIFLRNEAKKADYEVTWGQP